MSHSPDPETILAQRQRLYETPKMRDDLNDPEATVLLAWGEQQVEQLAQSAADDADYERRNRFLRKLLFSINRFVGQRQYNDRAGMQPYMQKILPWLTPLGYDVTEAALWAALPEDRADMMGTLRALLDAIAPPDPSPEPPVPPADGSDPQPERIDPHDEEE